jgi:CRP-like cAMP-binding protein
MHPERPTDVPGDAPPGSLPQDQVRETLRTVALFRGLDGEDLEQILTISEPVLVNAGDFVFEEGDRGDHFYILVRGSVELRKGAGDGQKRLAVLKAGQAFGEMALLNQTPRSASAYALEDTDMLSVSRAAFSDVLGGDTLAVRLLRNLSRSLWATSVRLASKSAREAPAGVSQEALADFNRLLRSRLLPRVTPRVSGYDLCASTLAPRHGSGMSAWDWILLPDGRPVFVVMRALRGDIFSAQRLAALRGLLRGLAVQPRASLGELLTLASRGMRLSWVDGLSGPVACALVALADGALEWSGAGDAFAGMARAGGLVEPLASDEVAVGGKADHAYRSVVLTLGARDRVILLSGRPDDPRGLMTSVITGGYTSSSRDVLNKLFDQLAPGHGEGGSATDVSGAVITRTTP